MTISVSEPKRAPLVLMIHRPDGLQAYGSYLVDAGFRVAEARSGAEGLDQAVALAPDFIVLDFELNGETVASLRGHDLTQRIPIIAMADLIKIGKGGTQDG